MIRLVEALNYRCLRYVSQPLADFQVLVGPNASGKTTFLDVIAFLGDLVGEGLPRALERATVFQDLLFGGKGDGLELAVELEVSATRRALLPAEENWSRARYEVKLGWVPDQNEVHICDERVLLKEHTDPPRRSQMLFPMPAVPPDTMMTGSKSGMRTVVRKRYEGNDNYYSEVHEKGGKGWAPSIRLGPLKSALGNLPADEEKFPVATWLRDVLRAGVEQIMLNSKALREGSLPGQGWRFKPDGSNLPWVVDKLRRDNMKHYRDWIAHVQTALPDLEAVESIEESDTRKRHLRLRYCNGIVTPSWTTSDGTLRLLALTLPAYLPDVEGVYLIEEPENGIHPLALETVFQALQSVYGAQTLLATHSPVILGQAQPHQVLCFKKNDQGATDIVRGDEHPQLKQWQDAASLADLYASGVLG